MGSIFDGVIDLAQTNIFVAPPQRCLNYVVGKLRVLRQKRAMKVSTENVAVDSAFTSVFAVVAEPGYNAAERLNPVAEEGAAAVVLEANDGRPVPFDDDVADEPLRLSARVDRVHVQNTSAG